VVKYGLLGDARSSTGWRRTAPRWRGRPGGAAAGRHPLGRDEGRDRRRDETEEGERALLNLGHTFCHALEKATGYSDRLLHGEGVAIGCALAFELSASGWACVRRKTPAGCAPICARWG
jgi:3-dehydroquinate synthase